MSGMRSRLLSEAELLIRARGFSGFSYADLSERVGIRKASVHHHFRSKLSLASALLGAYDERYSAAMSAILARNANAIERLQAYADLYRQGVEQSLGCLVAAFTIELATLPIELRSELDRFVQKHIAWIAQVIDDGQRCGAIRRDLPSEQLARLVFTGLEGALIVERAAGGPASFAALLATVLALLQPAKADRSEAGA